MAAFSYKGVSKKGKDVKGIRESVSRQTLTSELLSEGIFVTEVTDVRIKHGRFENIASLFSRKKNLADTFFQLSLLLRSGIPLVEAIKIIAKSAKHARLKNALLETAARVSEGMRFSDALLRYPNIFDAIYVQLIKASEQVGRLSAVLADIAVYEEDKRKNSDKLSSAMIYPMTVLILGLGVLGFLLTFVVPKMEAIFASMKQDIPTATKFLLKTSAFLEEYGFILLIFILFLIFFIRYMYKNNKKFRFMIDRRLYKINLIAEISAAKFAHVLAFQLKEGLPLTDAIYFAGETVNNSYLKTVISDVRTQVQSGTRFSAAIRNGGVFPELFPAAVSTGESSGNLPELLERVNEFYSKQADKLISSFVSIIEPLFIVFIGVLVGFIVVSIMEPLFQMNTLVR